MPMIEQIGEDRSEDYVEWRVHECYLWFRKHVLETDPDVEAYFKDYFRPNFVRMLENRGPAVWKKTREWLIECAVKLGQLAVENSIKERHQRVGVDHVRRGILTLQAENYTIDVPQDGKPREVSCADDPGRGGWCTGHP